MSPEVFTAEMFGTLVHVLLGCGVLANAALTRTMGNAGGFLMVSFGWSTSVFAGVYVAALSGSHLNPAITVGRWVNADAQDFAPGIDKTFTNALGYFSAQLLGAFLGALLCWIAYKKHFDAEPDPGTALGVFATRPRIRAFGWNLATELIATFILVFVILTFGGTPSGLGPLAVAILVLGIGVSLGGPTGCALNPARDLAPRIAHALLPIRGKGPSDWSYAWVPIVGPLAGAILAGLTVQMIDLPGGGG